MLHLVSGSFLSLPPNLGTKESRIGIYTHSEAHDASEEISEEVRFPLGNKDPSQFLILHCKRRNCGVQLPYK